MDNFKYGNMFDDILLMMRYDDVAVEAEFSELGEYKFDKIYNGIKSDLEKHKNDETPFYYNEIKTVADLTVNLKSYEVVGKLIDRILEALRTNNKEDKLKALAYLKLAIKYKTHSIKTFERAVPWALMDNDTVNKIGDDQELMKAYIFQLSLQEWIKKLMVGLTPRELQQLFPIEKEYDGDKWGTKDYYYCIQEINEIGLDTPMNEEQVMHYIMECNNNIFITMLGVSLMTLVSDFQNMSFWDMVEDMLNEPKEKQKLHLVVDNTK